jgi:hypothetical protein
MEDVQTSNFKVRKHYENEKEGIEKSLNKQ